VGRPIANQAIPTALIAPRLARAFDVDPMLDPLWRLKDADEPVIGRDEFQGYVWNAFRSETRVICVNGQRRTGMSFSKRILRSMLPDALVVEISADEVGRDAVALATLLLARCGVVVPPNESLPQSAASATTSEAWLRDQLLPALLERLRAVIGDRQVWIVLEHLDRHTVPESQAYELLLALMATPLDPPLVRFLLLARVYRVRGERSDLGLVFTAHEHRRSV
jgi:hypothetical protein